MVIRGRGNEWVVFCFLGSVLCVGVQVQEKTYLEFGPNK